MSINYSEIFKHAWQILKKNVALIAGIVVALILFAIVRGVISGIVGQGIVGFLVSFLILAAYVFLQVGSMKILLNLVDGKEAKIQQLWAYPQYVLNAFLVSLIIGGLFFILQFIFIFGILNASMYGLVALIVLIAEIYISLRLVFAIFYVVDKDMKAVEAIKASWERTKGSVLNLLIFFVIIVALNILGALLILIGLLVTIPLSFIAVTLLYRRFVK